MDAYCYILFSEKLNGFYIGATTIDPNERLKNHINQIYGKTKYTVKANDWEIYLTIKCKSKKQSLDIESHIKKMKSKKYIKNLKIYPEIIKKLQNKYSNNS
ncbi:MAG: GIY-YIG nuclease family protein [Bacteroidota bacterium]|nr:GIY-YIG nuclease family protein [Bacteroidota bacterium]